MSSTNKTTMGLNQWISADKPQMEDFNADNVLMDQLLGERYTKAEADKRFATLDGALLKTVGGTVTKLTDFTGGLKIGGKDAAYLEAGTWEPIVKVGDETLTINGYSAYYRRAGNICTVCLSINSTSTPTGTDTYTIHGIPYSPYGVGTSMVYITNGSVPVGMRAVSGHLELFKNGGKSYTKDDGGIHYLRSSITYLI